jgi:hypothetical protein
MPHALEIFFNKTKVSLGMVRHVCNPSTWEQRQEECEFEYSLSYIARSCLKKQNKTKNQPTNQPDKKNHNLPPLPQGFTLIFRT